jgi:hypothetical protein
LSILGLNDTLDASTQWVSVKHEIAEKFGLADAIGSVPEGLTERALKQRFKAASGSKRPQFDHALAFISKARSQGEQSVDDRKSNLTEIFPHRYAILLTFT